MRLLATLAIFVIAGSALAVESDSTKDIFPSIWPVHIDRLDSKSAEEFLRLSIAQIEAQVNILRTHNVPVRPRYEIMTDDNVLFTLRPVASFGEFDKPSSIPDSVKPLIAAQVDTFDMHMHTLLTEHHSEIWRYVQQLSHHPLNIDKLSTPPGYIHLVREKFLPDQGDNYYTAMEELRGLKDSLGYPFPTVVLSSSYGDGSYISMTIPPTRAEFEEYGDRERFIESKRGATAAKAWEEKLDATLSESNSRSAHADPALNPYAFETGWYLK